MPLAPLLPRQPQTATYQGAPMQPPQPFSPVQALAGTDPTSYGNPYQGAPNPAYQAPGADIASGANQALAGTGRSITPAQGADVDAFLRALQAQITGPGQEALAGQSGLITTQGDYQNQARALQEALTRQEAGFSEQQLGIQGANLGLQGQALEATAGPGGFQQQQRELTAAEEAQQFAQNQRSLRGQFAVGGTTGGNQVQSWSDLLKGYGFQQQQLALQGKEQQQAYQTSKAQLANAGKSLGISEAEVRARLDNAIKSFGLQGKIDANSIAQQIAALQQGFLSQSQASFLQSFLAITGIPIQAFFGG